MTASTVTSRAAASGSPSATATVRLGRPSTMRVRDRVREGLAVVAFSAVASTCVAVSFGVLLGILGSR